MVSSKVWKGLCCPCILLFRSILIYCFPCLFSYLNRCLSGFCCLICGCFRKCCRYKDKKFPTNHTSIGEHDGVTGSTVDDKVIWKRADELWETKPSLFVGSVEPSDIAQGALGDCWLLSAMASMAEFPGAIQNNFITKEHNVRGKYEIKIWNAPEAKWTIIVVDDFVPVCAKTSKPLFTQPHGEEMWVMLYEKAFAKYVGNYHGLSGGMPIWALEAMTGDAVEMWEREGDADEQEWAHLDIVHHPEKGKRNAGLRPSGLRKSSDTFFDLLLELDKKEAVIAAGSKGQGESKNELGIVAGHAYTILQVKKVGAIRLLNMRNPWGSFEWKGDWCDTSPLWAMHKKVKKVCKVDGKDHDDGLFWISWEDFSAHFETIDVCYRSSGFNDLAIDLNEEEGVCGPCKGCVSGCCCFWCGCRGTKALCCEGSADLSPSSDKQALLKKEAPTPEETTRVVHAAGPTAKPSYPDSTMARTTSISPTARPPETKIDTLVKPAAKKKKKRRKKKKLEALDIEGEGQLPQTAKTKKLPSLKATTGSKKKRKKKTGGKNASTARGGACGAKGKTGTGKKKKTGAGNGKNKKTRTIKAGAKKKADFAKKPPPPRDCVIDVDVGAQSDSDSLTI